MMRFLREPLVHFVILGALVFGIFTWLGDPRADPPERQIVLDEAAAARIAQRFEASWNRPPSESELSALIDSQIEEEILVREALLLGLDRDDAVVRQRLALKMRFLLEAGAEALEPSDAELAAHLEIRSERFMRPALVSFEQIVLPQNAESPMETLAALREGAEPDSIGAPTLLPESMQNVSARAVDNVFGDGFFAELEELARGEWQGPARSGYGIHLVRVTERRDAALPAIEDIREALVSDWRATRAQALLDERIDLLRAQYDILRPEMGGVQQ